MLNQIALITILTDDVPRLTAFYRDVLHFEVKQDMGGYVEFHHDGVRFAICARSILHEASGHESYTEAHHGQAFELAFPCAGPAEVDRMYAEIIAQGAHPSTLQRYAVGPAHRHVRRSRWQHPRTVCRSAAITLRRSVIVHPGILPCANMMFGGLSKLKSAVESAVK